MRITLFLVAIFMVSVASMCEDEDDLLTPLPTTINAYITANYPNYTVDESEQEMACDSSLVYEVELENGNAEIELVFDGEGNFLYSEEEINPSDLPAAVTTSVANNFTNYTLDDEASKMTMADGSIQYEVELEDSNDNDLEVIFASDGSVVCQEVEDEND